MNTNILRLIVSLGLMWLGTAQAEDLLRVGLASPSMTFVPIYIGGDTGAFARAGLNVTPIEFSGAAKLHQAILAGSADIALGGGTDYAFLVKGAPEIAVAALTDKPLNFAVIVGNDPAITRLASLRDARVGVSAVGTVTYWLTRELAVSQGWGAGGIKPVSIGASRSVLAAALQTGEVAAVISEPALGYQLEIEHRGRVLANTADYVPDFMTNAIFAATALSREHPDQLRRFLAAYFNAVAWLLDHKGETIIIAARQTGLAPLVLAREYDLWLPMWSRDGRIRPELLTRMSQALVDAGLLDQRADLSRYTTTGFLPGQ